jgi:hypothetical protein
MEAIRHHPVTNTNIEDVKRLIGGDYTLFDIIQRLLLVMNTTIEIPISSLISYLLGDVQQIDIDIPNDLINIIKSYLDYKCIVVYDQPIRFQLSCISKLMAHYNIEVPSIYDFVHNNLIYTVLINKKYTLIENMTINIEKGDGSVFRSFYLTEGENTRLMINFDN